MIFCQVRDYEGVRTKRELLLNRIKQNGIRINTALLIDFHIRKHHLRHSVMSDRNFVMFMVRACWNSRAFGVSLILKPNIGQTVNLRTRDKNFCLVRNVGNTPVSDVSWLTTVSTAHACVV